MALNPRPMVSSNQASTSQPCFTTALIWCAKGASPTPNPTSTRSPITCSTKDTASSTSPTTRSRAMGGGTSRAVMSRQANAAVRTGAYRTR
jgi:hypothetical protein